MAFNDAILRNALKLVPRSIIDSVPELIVNAVRKKLDSIQSNEDEIPVVIILPKGDKDCAISIGSVKGDLDIPEQERYSGKEFIESLLKEVNNV